MSEQSYEQREWKMSGYLIIKQLLFEYLDIFCQPAKQQVEGVKLWVKRASTPQELEFSNSSIAYICWIKYCDSFGKCNMLATTLSKN